MASANILVVLLLASAELTVALRRPEVRGLVRASRNASDLRRLQSCGSATFVAISTSECPSDSDLGNCYDSVACGELCEGDDECGTDGNLDNCASYDVYRRDCPTTAASFVYVSQSMYYDDARAYCRANYYDFASIHSSSENAAVDALCPGNCWIGGSDAAQEGTWTWSDGTAWDYENWYPGEPNNSGNEDYAEMWSDGTWNDTPNSYKTFVCSSSSGSTSGDATTGWTASDSNIHSAVYDWIYSRSSAESTYGHISTWDTSQVTDMAYLFCGYALSYCGSSYTTYKYNARYFNDDISTWDTSRVTRMYNMFMNAQDFNQDLSGWNIRAVTGDLGYLFYQTYDLDQYLGWCFEYDVSISYAFYYTGCSYSSCGVTQMSVCPTPAPTREPTRQPTQPNWGFQSGWCSSDLDEYVGDASSVQDCWEKCEEIHGFDLVAVDLDLEGQCYCQDECQCLDLGHGMGYYVATRDNVIAELPGMCGGCSDVCTEKMYKGSCTGFTREAKGKWGDWTLPEYEGIGCSKDQCCASNEGECCELNVGMIAGVAVAIFVVVAGCIGVCCFLGCKKRKQETGKPPSLPLVGDAREPPPPALAAMPPPTPPPALVPIPEHKKQRRFPDLSAPLPPTLAPIKAQAAGMMLNEETPPQPSAPVAEPVQSTSSVGWGARSLQRLASWRAPAPETSEMEPEPEVPAAEPEVPAAEPIPSSEGWGARGLQRLASWRAPAAAPPPITLGGKKVDVAQEELCSPRRVDMVHASVERWYNTTEKGAALRTRFGPFPATPEALNKWYARNKVMTAFLDDQGVPPEF